MAALCVNVAWADSVTVFRVVAPDGTVTYQDRPPKQGTGTAVEAREIDPDANVVPIERFPADAEEEEDATPTPIDPSRTVTQPAEPERPKPQPLPRDALVKGAAAAEASAASAAAAPAAVPPAPPAATPAPPAPPPPAISPGFPGP